MNTTAPAPGTPEWLKLVTASKVGAILGLSTWDSPYSMWRKMRGDVVEPERDATPAQERGLALESAILGWFYGKHPHIENTGLQEVVTLPGEDFALATLDSMGWDHEADCNVIVEAKSAASSDGWGVEGTDEVPADYYAQIMFQLALVPDAPRAYVPVIFGRPRFEFALYVIERDDELCGQILDRCREFYLSLSDDIAPDLDDSVATWDSVRKLHDDIESGEVHELSQDAAVEYLFATLAAKKAIARERAIKSIVLEAMARANYADCNGRRIARRQPGKYGVSLYQIAKDIEATSTETDAA